MINIYWCIKESYNKSLVQTFFFQSWDKFITKESFYKFHSKNNCQVFKNLFQIFLIYEFPCKKTVESFIVSLFSVSAEK